MGFLAMLALGAAVWLIYSAQNGVDPLRALRAFLRGEALPEPTLIIGDQVDGGERELFPGGGNPLLPGEPLKPYEGRLIRPVHGPVMSPFGMRWGRMHEGIDMACATGTPVVAAGSGRVTRAGFFGTAGNMIKIRHEPSTVETVYMHLSRIDAKLGAGVVQGQTIGLSGNTGRSSGPHLHFEVHVNGRPVDPLQHVPR